MNNDEHILLRLAELALRVNHEPIRTATAEAIRNWLDGTTDDDWPIPPLKSPVTIFEGTSAPPHSHWPAKSGDDEWQTRLTDGGYETFDPAIHSSGRDAEGRPLINADGSFRRRRKVKKTNAGKAKDRKPYDVDTLIADICNAGTTEEIAELESMERSINKSQDQKTRVLNALAEARARLEL